MPELRAVLRLLPANNSPTTAPTNGPIIMLKGTNMGMKKEAIKPTILPRFPAFVPPKRFVPQMGKK